jgi:hypothetical protein
MKSDKAFVIFMEIFCLLGTLPAFVSLIDLPDHVKTCRMCRMSHFFAYIWIGIMCFAFIESLIYVKRKKKRKIK